MDVVFFNNWISFYEDGLVIIYFMYFFNWRLERRIDIIEILEEGFEINMWIKLENYELGGKFFEGMGSMILDWFN